MEDMNRDKWSARTSPLKLLDTMVLFTLSACRISDIFSFFVGVEWLDGGGDDGLLAVTTSAFGGGGGDFGEILSGFWTCGEVLGEGGGARAGSVSLSSSLTYSFSSSGAGLCAGLCTSSPAPAFDNANLCFGDNTAVWSLLVFFDGDVKEAFTAVISTDSLSLRPFGGGFESTQPILRTFLKKNEIFTIQCTFAICELSDEVVLSQYISIYQQMVTMNGTKINIIQTVQLFYTPHLHRQYKIFSLQKKIKSSTRNRDTWQSPAVIA
jgi:hypothetical protein